MKQTNYHLFDFMDFEPFERPTSAGTTTQQKGDEALWKAYAPSNVAERNGDIVITIPYQKQLRQDDMAPDTTVPQQSYDLILRAYRCNDGGESRGGAPTILRIFTSMAGDAMVEQDDMLLLSPAVSRCPLSVRPLPGGAQVVSGSVKVATIDLSAPVVDHWSDLLPPPQPAPFITFYPDGDERKAVALSDDHFSPPRYDALPLGFCTVGRNTVAAQNDNNQTGGQGEGGDDQKGSQGQSADGQWCGSRAERATISFRCEADECFAGTGERFRKMDLSGQTFQLKNQDGQGVNNRRCYKNIPFFLSSRMYGAFFHTSDYCKLSLADHSTRSVQFMCDRATLDVFLIGGESPEAILRGYRSLTGFPQMPPLWSYGIWMSRMTYFSADEVEAICQRLRREHYPCDVIHLDTGWFRTDWLCEWRFNPERFPDPKGFIQRLKADGFKVSLWQLPYVAQGAEQLEEAKARGYISAPPVVTRGGCASNTPATGGANGNGTAADDLTPEADTRFTQGEEGSSSNFSALDYAGTIDFTNPAATRWYKNELLRPLLEMGVKCIKTDFGENIHMDHCYHGMTPERLNNIYSLLYQRAAYEVTRDVTGAGIVWARSAWAGCQRYPLHWGGDSESSWAGMAGSLKGGLHFGLSGFAFWSHDVPGFHSVPDFMNSPLDPEVYVRWTQFGIFSSHIRYHGTCKREPWHYPTIAPIVKRWWQLRYQLLPYIIRQSELCCRSGWPMVRALLMHYPHDRQVWHIDDEYFFGADFLVCPVMSSGQPAPDGTGYGPAQRDIYLPEGPWVNFFTGERLQGGRWYYHVDVPLDQMPVFVRPDAEIPLYPDAVDSTDDYDPSRTIVLRITPDYEGLPSSF